MISLNAACLFLPKMLAPTGAGLATFLIAQRALQSCNFDNKHLILSITASVVTAGAGIAFTSGLGTAAAAALTFSLIYFLETPSAISLKMPLQETQAEGPEATAKHTNAITDLEAQLQEAQTALEKATTDSKSIIADLEAQLQETQAEGTKAAANHTNATTVLEAQLREAQAALEKVTTDSQSIVAGLEEQLQEAQAEGTQAAENHTNAIAELEAQLQEAQAALEKATTDSQSIVAGLEAKLQETQAKSTQAAANHTNAIAELEAQLREAQAALEKATIDSRSIIASLEAQLQEAQATLEKATIDSRSIIASLEAQLQETQEEGTKAVTKHTSAITGLEAQLQEAQATLEKATIDSQSTSTAPQTQLSNPIDFILRGSNSQAIVGAQTLPIIQVDQKEVEKAIKVTRALNDQRYALAALHDKESFNQYEAFLTGAFSPENLIFFPDPEKMSASQKQIYTQAVLELLKENFFQKEQHFFYQHLDRKDNLSKQKNSAICRQLDFNCVVLVPETHAFCGIRLFDRSHIKSSEPSRLLPEGYPSGDSTTQEHQIPKDCWPEFSKSMPDRYTKLQINNLGLALKYCREESPKSISIYDYLARLNASEAIQYCMKYLTTPIDYANETGKTAAHAAAFFGSMAAMNALAPYFNAHGSTKDSGKEKKPSLISMAVLGEQVEMAQQILKYYGPNSINDLEVKPSEIVNAFHEAILSRKAEEFLPVFSTYKNDIDYNKFYEHLHAFVQKHPIQMFLNILADHTKSDELKRQAIEWIFVIQESGQVAGDEINRYIIEAKIPPMYKHTLPQALQQKYPALESSGPIVEEIE